MVQYGAIQKRRLRNQKGEPLSSLHDMRQPCLCLPPCIYEVTGSSYQETPSFHSISKASQILFTTKCFLDELQSALLETLLKGAFLVRLKEIS